MDPKINLRGMIRLDDVEDLLTNVLRRLDAQDTLIAKLTNTLQTLMPVDIARESYGLLQSSIDSLAGDISRLREASLVNIDDRSLPVSKVVADNHSLLRRLSERSAILVEKADFELQLKVLSARWKTDSDYIKEWAAPIDMVKKMQSSQTETVRRLNGVESLLSCKLDRSEIGYLEGLANNFEAYSEFQKEVQVSLNGLNKTVNDHRDRIAESKAKIDQLRNISESTALKITSLAPKTETRAILREFEAQREAMNRFCDKDRVDDLNDKMSSHAMRMSAAEELLRGHQNELQIINKILPTKADEVLLDAYVQHPRVDELSRLVALKANQTEITKNGLQVHARLEKLDTSFEDLNHRLGVALRFVEWFTHRGETYEHNMKLIDKHLHGLATSASDPKNKQIFDSSIRYTMTSDT